MASVRARKVMTSYEEAFIAVTHCSHAVHVALGKTQINGFHSPIQMPLIETTPNSLAARLGHTTGWLRNFNNTPKHVCGGDKGKYANVQILRKH